MRKRILIGAVFFVLAGVAIFFYLHRKKGTSTVQNVLLITIDTMRADHLGSYGYGPAQTPHLDSWAQRGAMFLNAIATTPLTLPSHSSMMTGEYPFTHGVRDNGGFYLEDKSNTLAETMRKAGFRTGGFVSAFVLDRRWGISQGFEHYFDNFELSKYKMVSLDSVQRKGEETMAEALKWIEQNKQSKFFGWIHLYDPHTPYEPPEPFRSAAVKRGPTGLYDAEIAYVDHLMGRLEEHLKKHNLLDTTLVVLTADHGESLGEHEETGHGFFIYDATVRVPLIVLSPGQKPQKIQTQVRTIDLFATICDAAGVSGISTSGVSLMPLVRGEPFTTKLTAYSESFYPRFHYGWSELKALRTNDYKYIDAPRREFYRLSEDSRELNNLYLAERKKVSPFEAEVQEMIAKAGAWKAPQAIDDDSLEKLQALGYIGTATHSLQDPDAKLADPKDKIRLYNRVKIAQWLSAEDKIDEAFKNIREVLQQDDHILEAHLVLGNLHLKQDEQADALKSFQNALEVDPEYSAAIFALARVYKEMGNYEAARAGFARLIEKDARDSKPYVHLSEIAIAEKKFDEALTSLQKVIELDPSQGLAHNRLGACYLEMEQFDKALPEFKKALELNPNIPHAHFNSALVYEAKGQMDLAVSSYREELKLYPEAYTAHFNLSRIFRQQGRRDAERQELEACVQQKPDFGIAYLYLAKNLMDSGDDLMKAKSLVEEGLPKVQEKSQIPLGHYLLADIYNRLGQPREAMSQVEKARTMQKSL